VREIVNGQPQRSKIPFKPTLFTTNQKTPNTETPWRTLDDIPAYPIKPGGIDDAKAFIKTYEGVQDFNIFGQSNYALQYISENYKDDVLYDSDLIKILTLDIELLVSESGVFPDPKFARDEIVLITLQDKTSNKITTFGSRPYTGKYQEDYVQCVDEKELLNKFLLFWQYDYPDIVVGYNSDTFDIPYIVNRIKHVLGDAYKRLSPWGFVDEQNINVQGKEEQMYKIIGISSLDYLVLYKKYTYKNRESYSLGNIGAIELGESKLEHTHGTTFREYCTGVYDVLDLGENPTDHNKLGFRRTQLKKDIPYLDSVRMGEYEELDKSLRQSAWNEYTLYNRMDVELITKLDDKLKLINLHLTMAYMGKLNYNDALSPVKLWDSIIYNNLLKKHIVIPNSKHQQKGEQFIGAYVKEPLAGMHQWVASFDLASLYPSLIRQCNISPETISTTKLNITLDTLLNKDPLPKTDLSITANGWCYRKDKQGFLPELMETLYVSRTVDKKQMLKCEQEYELVKNEIKKRGL
jgi:DNA polymerase elongation subunit (family B)